jgi:hypothetical protein
MAYVQYLEHVQSHEARSFHNRFKTISLLTRKPNSSCYVLLRQPVALRVYVTTPCHRRTKKLYLQYVRLLSHYRYRQR